MFQTEVHGFPMSIWHRILVSQPVHLLTDEALCSEAKKGHYEAYLVLFDRYWRQVFRLANSVLHDEGEAEDVAQALFLEVHRSMLQFDSKKGSFRTLLLRYAYTRAIDQRRRLEARRFYSSIRLEDIPPITLQGRQCLSSGLGIEDASRLIQQGMRCLDEQQRLTIEAYFFRGLSLQEIAEELDESLGNARHYLYRGIKKMRKFIVVDEAAREPTQDSRKAALEARLKRGRDALSSEV